MKGERKGTMRKEALCGSIGAILLSLTITMAVTLGISTGAWAAPFAYVAIRFANGVGNPGNV